MGVVEIIKEMIEGFREGGAEEALAEGGEEVVEEKTGRDL